ncbi:MAG TPA: CPBP family glutamic-type intramembrane protease [Atribacteraceae bacterium]|nr:CPBP family glutamic-type intramembrane protease [Atribacteraceae bacterium]
MNNPLCMIKELSREYWKLLATREGTVIITGIMAVVLYDISFQERWFGFFSGERMVFNNSLITALWFLVVPMAINAATCRIPWKDLGGGFGMIRQWGPWFLVLLGLGAGWAFIVSRSPGYRDYYPMYRPAAQSVQEFFVFQGFVAVTMYVWEFFCRGFLLFGLAKKMGRYAILVQLIIFTLLHRGKPEYLISIVGGLGMGIFAFEAKTFFPVFLLHLSVSVLLDIFCIL